MSLITTLSRLQTSRKKATLTFLRLNPCTLNVKTLNPKLYSKPLKPRDLVL